MILHAVRGLYHPKLGVVVDYVRAFHLTGCAWALGWIAVP